MDGSNIDHSDSDSGDSWTILDHCPAHGDEAPEFSENVESDTNTAIPILDKDEDTDGISIISDSETESPISCEMVQDLNITEQSRPADVTASQFITFNTFPLDSTCHETSLKSDNDFLVDNSAKRKTYVHRRNKRLSTMLNIIMLGSVITATGVAIGHMWGARNDCAIHTAPSINKILSNLYKLQEENTYLRNKLKELTLVNSLHMQHKKVNTADKLTFKQQRCKKIYEEPLGSKSTGKITKCIETEINNIADNNLHKHLVQPEFEKSFVRDIEKLKHIYQQNRSWLDEEIVKRLQHEEDNLRKNIKSPLSSITEEQKSIQDDNTRAQIDTENDQLKLRTPDKDKFIKLELDYEDHGATKPMTTARKISYADSLKSHQPYIVEKKEIDPNDDKHNKDNVVKRKIKRNADVTINDVNLSEEDFKKDDRYIGQKYKPEKKKRDRQKLHKKQKRRNKYEQWEMKGGYMKDYDDFSMTSIQDPGNILQKSDGNQLSREFERMHYINQLTESDSIQKINLNNKPNRAQTKNPNGNKINTKSGDANWYDKRALLRTEARKRLEHELFGETSSSNAGWYFRRMQKREQCRAKSDNSTYKKLYKRNMNYKVKQ